MLCSIPPSSSRRSASNWLHRLRSSRGFPSASPDIDLEQFLAHPDPLPPNSGHSDPIPPTAPALHPPQIQTPSHDGEQLFSLVSNVLAELFIMGDSPVIHAKKSSRKQPNPRFCVPLNSSDFSNNYDNSDRSIQNAPGKNDSASPLSDDNSGVGLPRDLCCDEHLKLLENVYCGVEQQQEEEVEEEEEKGYGNLSGFSRTEVTVIDTSFARWKFDKMLFRKKNVWKVRDKKGKMIICGNKKRKSSNVDTGFVCGGEVKKPKVLDGQCVLSKKGTERESKEEYRQNNISQKASRKISDNFGKAMKNKKATSNSENGSSSVVLIKNIPTGKKSGASISRSCPKSFQKQLKE